MQFTFFKKRKGNKEMLDKVGKKKIIADVILISVLLLVALSVFLLIEGNRADGAYAVVTVDGKEVARYSLAEDGEHVLNEGSNILVIKDGKAFMKRADCPDGLCINQGEVSRTGERIVCLPNRVMIEIVGADDEMLEV